ncbi:MAG TPA: diaminopimelate epimerase [Pyrinomonadaceae bacterium]|jgi:diaminopimelate epimerase
MNPISFCKFHGFGNDYIVFEAAELKDVSALPDFAARVCNRHTGIGGDGIAVVKKLFEATAADYSCRIINPDGSEAGFSGNGTRCAVAYLHYKNLWREPNLRLETNSGLKNYELLKRDGDTFWFLAELGKPKFDLHNAARADAAKIAGEKNLKMSDFSTFLLPREGLALKFFYVDVGNPVACIFVEDFDEFDWRRVGQMMESNTEIFPERTNVVFIKTLDMENIEIRIWERGAGETSSSGTCSIAAALAHLRRENLRGTVQVRAPGGTTEAVWREDDEMLITGRADLAFCGEISR